MVKEKEHYEASSMRVVEWNRKKNSFLFFPTPLIPLVSFHSLLCLISPIESHPYFRLLFIYSHYFLFCFDKYPCLRD